MRNTKDTVVEIDHLSDVRGGASPLFQPAGAAAAGAMFRVGFTPLRMMGMFMPNTMRMMATAAKMRHDLWVGVRHGGDPKIQAVHDQWIHDGYGEFASHLK